jgi:hypothetical protein
MIARQTARTGGRLNRGKARSPAVEDGELARKISKFKRKSPLRKNVENLSFDRGLEGAQL